MIRRLKILIRMRASGDLVTALPITYNYNNINNNNNLTVASPHRLWMHTGSIGLQLIYVKCFKL
jgi:hypothetical protein